MIELVRSWLLGVTGVAILTAMAENLMPRGTVKGVGQLTAGLVLMLAVISPILSLDLDSLLPNDSWEEEIAQSQLDLDTAQKKELEAIIASQLGAYIVDKAEAEGISCTATVVCQLEEGIYLPQQVTIQGTFQPDQREILLQLVEEGLDISQDNIFFTEEGES